MQRRSHRATRQIFIGFFIYDSSFSTETFRIKYNLSKLCLLQGHFFPATKCSLQWSIFLKYHNFHTRINVTVNSNRYPSLISHQLFMQKLYNIVYYWGCSSNLMTQINNLSRGTNARKHLKRCCEYTDHQDKYFWLTRRLNIISN